MTTRSRNYMPKVNPMHLGDHSLSCQDGKHAWCMGCNDCACHKFLNIGGSKANKPTTPFRVDIARLSGHHGYEHLSNYVPLDEVVDNIRRKFWVEGSHSWYFHRILSRIKD